MRDIEFNHAVAAPLPWFLLPSKRGHRRQLAPPHLPNLPHERQLLESRIPLLLNTPPRLSLQPELSPGILELLVLTIDILTPPPRAIKHQRQAQQSGAFLCSASSSSSSSSTELRRSWSWSITLCSPLLPPADRAAPSPIEEMGPS